MRSALIHTTAWTYTAVAPPILMLLPVSAFLSTPIPFDFFYFKNTSFVPGCAFSLLPLRPDISLRELRGRHIFRGGEGLKGGRTSTKNFTNLAHIHTETHAYSVTLIHHKILITKNERKKIEQKKKNRKKREVAKTLGTSFAYVAVW